MQTNAPPLTSSLHHVLKTPAIPDFGYRPNLMLEISRRFLKNAEFPSVICQTNGSQCNELFPPSNKGSWMAKQSPCALQMPLETLLQMRCSIWVV